MPSFGDLPSRGVTRLVDPAFEPGYAARYRAHRLIQGDAPTTSDPFLLVTEDFMPRGALGRHPHRGVETVTLVLGQGQLNTTIAPATAP